jgi:hypothetical protein
MECFIFAVRLNSIVWNSLGVAQKGLSDFFITSGFLHVHQLSSAVKLPSAG